MIISTHRLANLYQLTDSKILDNVITKIKGETSLDKEFASDGLYLDSNIVMQVEKVEQRLGINSSYETFENMTAEILKSAGEKFIFLNLCPKSLNSWFEFYRDLFEAESPYKILLTLSRLLAQAKKTPKNKKFVSLARKLLKTTKNLLNYEKIGNIFPGQKRNTSFLVSTNLDTEGKV